MAWFRKRRHKDKRSYSAEDVYKILFGKPSNRPPMLLRLITVLITIFVFAACEEVEPPTALDAGMTAPNRSPTAPTVAIAPANPTTTDDLTVSIAIEAKDPDMDAVTYTYKWLKDSAVQDDLTTDTIPAAQTAKGQTWKVLVIASDGKAESTPAEAEVTIGNTVPTVMVTLSPSAPKTGDDLVVIAISTDADEDTVTLSYSWTKEGDSTTKVSDTISASETEHGQRWVVTVTPNDGDDDGDAVTAEITIGVTPPVLDTVTIAPDPATVSDAITATPGTSSDADSDPVTLAYAWTVNSVVVAGQTTATLPAGSATKGQQVQVTVTPNDGTDDGVPVMSNVITIGNTAPSITSVSITPTAGTEATTFSCDPQGWADVDNDTEGYTYQWYVGGSTIAVTSRTITGANFNKHDIIHCVATPFDGTVSGAALPSSTVTIANTPPSVGSVSIGPATPSESDTITITISGWNDADGDTEGYLYEWRIGTSVVGSGNTLTGSAFNRGDSISVVVTPFDSEASGTAVTSNAVTVVNTAPSITGVTLLPATAYTTSNITATPEGWTDLDGDSPSYEYAWYKNTNVITGVTGAVLDSSNFVRGDGIYVTATPNDGTVSDNLVASTTLNISNSLPTAPTISISPTEPTDSDDLTCNIDAFSTDADSNSVNYSYAWTQNTNSTAYITNLVPSTATSDNDTWQCTVTPDDGTDDGASASASVTVGCENGSSAICAGTSCATILGINSSATDGTYWLDPDGTGGNAAFQVYCQMSKDGIAWIQSTVNNLYFNRTAVTVAQYEACVTAGSCTSGLHLTSSSHSDCNYGNASRSDHPMNCVNWYGAGEYCTWVGARLPDENEWYAEASNGGSRLYPWGDTPQASCSHVIMNDTSAGGIGCGMNSTGPVCSKPLGNSVSGLCDLSGNIWEWTTTPSGSDRVVRGGSWRSDVQSSYLQASGRFDYNPNQHSGRTGGFRCVSASPPS